MKRSPSRPWLAALLALPFAITAGPAGAQDAPALPAAAPAPPPPPGPPVQPGSPVQPVPYEQPAPWAPPPWAPPAYVPPPSYGPPPSFALPATDTARRGPSGWYGWQTIIAVAPFDIAMFAGLPNLGQTNAGTGLFTAGLVGRTLAPAVVHWAHGRVGTGFASIGLHLATTATGLAIGYGFGIALQPPCKPPNPCTNGFLTPPDGPIPGAVVGSIVGTALDVVFFAHRQRMWWTAEAPVEKKKALAWGVAPYATPKGAGVAGAGAF